MLNAKANRASASAKPYTKTNVQLIHCISPKLTERLDPNIVTINQTKQKVPQADLLTDFGGVFFQEVLLSI